MNALEITKGSRLRESRNVTAMGETVKKSKNEFALGQQPQEEKQSKWLVVSDPKQYGEGYKYSSRETKWIWD